MEDSIFTKIIKGKIPSHKVYEDEDNFAFLDIHPLQPGHVLVVPKKQVAAWTSLDDDTYISLMKAAKKIGSHLKEVLDKPYVGVKIEGTDVPHVHVHLIPFTSPDEFNATRDLSAEPDHTALADMAAKLSF